ncbi:MAG: sigma-70 family RNA polymerase sigma factor [Bryobacteraceae bacterium]|jgi:RNA polymerase sigma-70 factor (ECF subfamily)
MDENRRREDEMSAGAPAVSAPTGELERVFQAHHGRVFRAAYRITGNAGDAEDVLQTVFLKLLRQGWTTASVGCLEGYLHRAAVNGALDLMRDRATARSIPLEEAASAADSRLRPDRRYGALELRACLRQAIARLTPRAAEIFALRYFEDYGNQEIAGLLGVSPSEIAVSLHRSRKRLQEEIRSYLGDNYEQRREGS